MYDKRAVYNTRTYVFIWILLHACKSISNNASTCIIRVYNNITSHYRIIIKRRVRLLICLDPKLHWNNRGRRRFRYGGGSIEHLTRISYLYIRVSHYFTQYNVTIRSRVFMRGDHHGLVYPVNCDCIIR